MALDFACRDFDIEEVIRCGLGLTKTDLYLLKIIMSSKNTSLTAHSLSKNSKFDLSTVQRSLKRLYEKGALKRSQSNLSGGGYIFSYSSKPKSEIKSLLLSTVHNWVSRVEKEFDRW